MDHKKRETANDACKTLEEALSHASTLEGNVATLQGELRRKKRKSTRKRAEITVQKRILRQRMRAVNDLDLDYELGVAEPNNDPAVALPELVRHVRSLNSVQGTQEHVCKMARLRATSLLNHLDLDRMFSVSTAETKAELAITQAAADSAKKDAEEAQAAADSAKKDAEEAQLTKEAGEAYYAWQDLITEAEAYVGDAATKQAMVKRADEAHDTYLAVLCRGA